MRAEHALAILERSAAADITVSICFSAHHSRTFRQLSAVDITNGHAVVRAIAQKTHLERITQLSLQLTAVAWDEDVFAPFLHQGEPLPMPSLRSLSIYTWDSEELASARPIRIRAFNLEQITIESCNVWAWSVFAGARTTHVSIGGFTLKMSDLASLLELAPNLDRLNIGSLYRPTHIHNDISPEAIIRVRRSLSAHPRAGSRLTHFDAVSVVAPGLALLCQILPTQLCVPNMVLIQTAPDDEDDDDWLEFLMIPRI
ncbi:hypothetical protein EXIGLDRAFT_335961 [Exidia glandulosa HHB12029]|uniref:F-box domain-containing protein n=1 Tax=Exidia glandulosa HHB12029 TaxID=1314781 RepID=A0A165CLB4_EXIGL|nr:hypothetical protein EXIGLDRAFT_335961 [Exidia glandulosa HHB12029]